MQFAIEAKQYSVLQKTYALLSAGLLVAALAAAFGTTLHFSVGGYIGLIILSFVMLFATFLFREGPLGILMVLGFTGLEGLSLGPVLQHYLHLAHGAQIIGQAAGMTGVIFVGLSLYAMKSKTDFSYLGSFLFAGLFALLIASIAGLFFHMPAFQLTLSVIGALIFSGYILYDTNRIVRGGETNYLLATVSLFLDIENLFLDLLRILSIVGSKDD